MPKFLVEVKTVVHYGVQVSAANDREARKKARYPTDQIQSWETTREPIIVTGVFLEKVPS
jgi:hypothetical protein